MKKILISLCTGAMLISSSGVCGSKGLSDGLLYRDSISNSIITGGAVTLGTFGAIGSSYGLAAVTARNLGRVKAAEFCTERIGMSTIYFDLTGKICRLNKCSGPFKTLDQSYLNGFYQRSVPVLQSHRSDFATKDLNFKKIVITEPIGASLYEGMSQAFKTGFKNAACNKLNIFGAVALGYYAAKNHLSDENA